MFTCGTFRLSVAAECAEPVAGQQPHHAALMICNIPNASARAAPCAFGPLRADVTQESGAGELTCPPAPRKGRASNRVSARIRRVQAAEVMESRDEAHVSTLEPGSRPSPRVPRPHGHQGRPPCAFGPPRQGPQEAVGLIRPARLLKDARRGIDGGSGNRQRCRRAASAATQCFFDGDCKAWRFSAGRAGPAAGDAGLFVAGPVPGR